ncbi:EamA family transporter [Snodgrassella sp. CFCC 13594]|uniref:EamA family transporter n=1 Tax=Snodgrassella sp. CFCC 13594 TaxID=1775559 RepID=UPI000A76B0F2|nr:EamA family transporter [Snodgrassella sp. CFCC 13594]
MASQLTHIDVAGWVALVYLAYMATLGGYGAWGSLLSRYPAGKIAPLSLLVPVVALLVAQVFLRESLNAWQWLGVTVVMAALVVQVFGARWFKAT